MNYSVNHKRAERKLNKDIMQWQAIVKNICFIIKSFFYTI